MKIAEIVAMMNAEDRANLWKILTKKDSGAPTDPAAYEEELRWMYHNRARVQAQQNVASAFNRITGKKEEPKTETFAPSLTYEKYIDRAMGFFHVDATGADLPTKERYLADQILVVALQRMSAKQRVEFFDNYNERGGSISNAADDAHREVMRRHFAVTNALGFLTHAVGFTLPFALSLGLGTTFAFLAGPPGWLGLSFWAFIRLTGPKWDRVSAALLYIAAVRSR